VICSLDRFVFRRMPVSNGYVPWRPQDMGGIRRAALRTACDRLQESRGERQNDADEWTFQSIGLLVDRTTRANYGKSSACAVSLCRKRLQSQLHHIAEVKSISCKCRFFGW
jgi:hypothetical protein